ncbi:hypothetical protein [Kitasatospora sp. NPDC093102]
MARIHTRRVAEILRAGPLAAGLLPACAGAGAGAGVFSDTIG